MNYISQHAIKMSTGLINNRSSCMWMLNSKLFKASSDVETIRGFTNLL